MSVLEMNAAKFPAPVKALYVQVQAVAEWGKDGLVEIVVVSGFYQMSRRSIRASTSSRRAACSAVESLDCNASWSKCLIGA